MSKALPYKRLLEAKKLAKSFGYAFKRFNGSGHMVFVGESGSVVTLSGSKAAINRDRKKFISKMEKRS